jgi:hypothetical protein
MLVSLRLDQHIEDLTFSVDGAPEIHHPPIDFQIDLVEMPFWAWAKRQGTAGLPPKRSSGMTAICRYR